MRDLVEVLDRIIPLCRNLKLTVELGVVKESALYAAPETMQFWWTEAGKSLCEHIFPGPQAEWEHEVIKIWSGKA